MQKHENVKYLRTLKKKYGATHHVNCQMSIPYVEKPRSLHYSNIGNKHISAFFKEALNACIVRKVCSSTL
jgi:hypothetical protein